MAKRRRLPDLADDQRCTRNGTNWRCHLPRLPGKSYCQKHQLFNLHRSQSKSKSKHKSLPDSDNTTTAYSATNLAHPSFTLREIWAFLNPRVYARIERKIPAESLVEVTPLIPPAPDAACGLFRTSDTTEMKDVAGFSHRVWFEMEGEGVYKILPRKGEIWAVEMYGWVEMVTSFVEGEGASGTVLVLEAAEEEEEGGGVEVDGGRGNGMVFRRRLHDGCELIRRFTAGELWMFLHRVSEAKVMEVHSLLEGCTIAIEGENIEGLKEDVLRIEDSNNLQSEDCYTNIEDSNVEDRANNNIEEQAGDPPEGNEGQNAPTFEEASNIQATVSHQTSEGNLNLEPVNSHQTLETIAKMDGVNSHQTVEGVGSHEEVSTAKSLEGEAKEVDQKHQNNVGNLPIVPEQTPVENSSN